MKRAPAATRSIGLGTGAGKRKGLSVNIEIYEDPKVGSIFEEDHPWHEESVFFVERSAEML